MENSPETRESSDNVRLYESRECETFKKTDSPKRNCGLPNSLPTKTQLIHTETVQYPLRIAGFFDKFPILRSIMDWRITVLMEKNYENHC